MLIFYKNWKKYNEIQLTTNEMDLNNWKITNHPHSRVKSDYKVNVVYFWRWSILDET